MYLPSALSHFGGQGRWGLPLAQGPKGHSLMFNLAGPTDGSLLGWGTCGTPGLEPDVSAGGGEGQEAVQCQGSEGLSDDVSFGRPYPAVLRALLLGSGVRGYSCQAGGPND